MRIVAILATYNEERFIGACLEHLIGQGVEVYLIDNQSEDRTREIAQEYLGVGLIGIETMTRYGMYSWRNILRRKEQLAATLGANWCLHVDADEIRLAPKSGQTLAEAFAEVERKGYNAVNFMEFTFVPTQEDPNHDHAGFQQTMNWYYPYLPAVNQQVRAWKAPSGKADLAWSGGHQVSFEGLRIYPVPFPFKHYLFLSVEHATRKYVQRVYDPSELERGWHRARAQLVATNIRLQSSSELRCFRGDDQLDPSRPLTRHPLFD